MNESVPWWANEEGEDSPILFGDPFQSHSSLLFNPLLMQAVP